MLRAMLGYMETASSTSSKMRSASRREMSKGSAKSLKIGRPTQHPRPSTEVMCSPPTFVGTQSYIGDNDQRPFSSIRKDKFLAWTSALPTMKLNAQRRYCSTTASAPAFTSLFKSSQACQRHAGVCRQICLGYIPAQSQSLHTFCYVPSNLLGRTKILQSTDKRFGFNRYLLKFHCQSDTFAWPLD